MRTRYKTQSIRLAIVTLQSARSDLAFSSLCYKIHVGMYAVRFFIRMGTYKKCNGALLAFSTANFILFKKKHEEQQLVIQLKLGNFFHEHDT